MTQKASAYNAPFVCATPAVAIRAFNDSINNSESPFNSHPEDYILFLIGEFEPTTGELIPENITSIAKGIDLKESNGNF